MSYGATYDESMMLSNFSRNGDIVGYVFLEITLMFCREEWKLNPTKRSQELLGRINIGWRDVPTVLLLIGEWEREVRSFYGDCKEEA